MGPKERLLKDPSTRIRIFSNPQLFLSGYGNRPHASESDDLKSVSSLSPIWQHNVEGEQSKFSATTSLYGACSEHILVHVNELSKNIASGVSAIKRIRHMAPFTVSKTLLTIYNSLVQPHLDYSSSVWGSCSKSLSQKLQNRAARVITFSNYERSTDELLRMVN